MRHTTNNQPDPDAGEPDGISAPGDVQPPYEQLRQEAVKRIAELLKSEENPKRIADILLILDKLNKENQPEQKESFFERLLREITPQQEPE